MLPALFDHTFQSTLFAAAAGLLTLALRKNRAQIRYWLWFAASLKFLIPFSILVEAGSQFGWHTAPAIAPAGLSSVIEQISEPFAAPVPLLTMPAAADPSSTNWIPAILCVVWAIGFVTLVTSWCLRWRSLRAALRTALPVPLSIGHLPIDMEVMTSPAFAEPGVFGVRRPILLLPAGIVDQLTPPQLEAILAHELCHVRRRDNLATAIHMAVEAMFWFHPLVWWLGARLMEERERACDEDVLLGSEPQVYAEGILKICELYLESPVPCVSGVTGANLKKRIEAIMSNRTVLKLNFAQKVALAAAGMAALAAPIVVGVLNAPAIRAQSPQAAAQSAAVTAKFEVASIKPCSVEDGGGGGGRGKGGGRGSGGISWSPGRFHWECGSVYYFIRDAYLAYPEGKPWTATTREEPSPSARDLTDRGCSGCGRGLPPISDRLFREPFKGSPDWINSDRYTIDAKADGPASPEMMRGPMMQAVLEGRFKLKVHHESREIPVYELTVAPGGPKLQPSQEGSCFTFDPAANLPPRPVPGQVYPRPCGSVFMQMQKSESEFAGTTIAGFCRNLSNLFDRDVIDKTGIAGLFDIRVAASRIVLAPDDAPADRPVGVPDPPAQTDRPATFKVFQSALPKIGLKLEPAKGPGLFLVIDHVERPSGN